MTEVIGAALSRQFLRKKEPAKGSDFCLKKSLRNFWRDAPFLDDLGGFPLGKMWISIL